MDPLITSYDTLNPPLHQGKYNPVPKPGSPLLGHAATVPAYARPNNSYVPTTYAGAFPGGVSLRNTWIGNGSWCFAMQSHILDPNLCCTGMRGNVNGVGSIDLSDLSALVSYLTGGTFVPQCMDAANVNGVGSVDLSDLSSLVSYLTGGSFVPGTCS